MTPGSKSLPLARIARCSSGFRIAHGGYEVIRDERFGFIYSITGLAPVQAMGLLAGDRREKLSGIRMEGINLERRRLDQIDGHRLYYALVDRNPHDTRATKAGEMPEGCNLFYFRARHDEWRLEIDDDVIASGDFPGASSMPFSVAEEIIRRELKRFHRQGFR